MKAKIEEDLILVKSIPKCIRATFKLANVFESSSDNRSDAYIFNKSATPSIFIEVIHTLPFKVRGNHVHKNYRETLSVLSGELEFYVRCDCTKKHVYMQLMKAGDTVITERNIAHAMFTLKKSEFVAFFENCPTNDRIRTPILKFSNS